MQDQRNSRQPVLEMTARCLVGFLLVAVVGVVEAAPQTTRFVHSVGFSFDYPTKWSLETVVEGLMLLPHNVGTDYRGRPLELVVIGFVDTAGVTDPFDPSFANAFERGYRAIVPDITRVGDLDWIETSMGTGMVVPFEDPRGTRHHLYCNVRGGLGVFLAHVSSSRPQTAKVRQIFSSFGWTESVIDPVLVRSWTAAGNEVSNRSEGGVELELQRPGGQPLRLH